MNIYGAVVTAGDVRTAVVDTMKAWTPAYIGEVSKQSGRERCGDDALPPFRSFGTASSFATFPEDQLPGLVVVVPGLAATPIRQADGMYLVEWSVGLGVVVSGRDRDSTDELVRLYAAVARMTAVQQPTMGGFAHERAGSTRSTTKPSTTRRGPSRAASSASGSPSTKW